MHQYPHPVTLDQTGQGSDIQNYELIKLSRKNYLDGRTSLGTNGAYVVSLSAASLCAFWNSLRTDWKSFASLASAIFLAGWSLMSKCQGIRI